MHMNWLEISIGIVFLICIITGLVRGAIRIMVSLIATIVTFAIVFFATPYVSQAVEKYTPLDDMIKQKVVSTMADVPSITQKAHSFGNYRRRHCIRTRAE